MKEGSDSQDSNFHDQICKHCMEGGDLILCDGKNCTTAYHYRCADIPIEDPRVKARLKFEQWFCPKCVFKLQLKQRAEAQNWPEKLLRQLQENVDKEEKELTLKIGPRYQAQVPEVNVYDNKNPIEFQKEWQDLRQLCIFDPEEYIKSCQNEEFRQQMQFYKEKARDQGISEEKFLHILHKNKYNINTTAKELQLNESEILRVDKIAMNNFKKVYK